MFLQLVQICINKFNGLFVCDGAKVRGYAIHKNNA
jgi:hypothetical protein